ncbi:MAG: Xaa-Pro peptidase family protein [Sulfolobales archaeon]|nr:Xaa-Pro peptidase family protein [Sulfolobales archaeon]
MRIRRVVELLESKNLDSVMITRSDNLQYYLNIDILADSIAILYVSRSGEAVIYTPPLEYHRFRDSLKELDVKAFSKTIKLPNEVVVEKSLEELIIDLAKGSSRIGVDVESSPIASKVIKVIGDKLVDVTSDIYKQRMVKESSEVEAIRESINATIAGIKAVASMLSNDVTEVELAGLFEARARSMGSREQAFPTIVLFKPTNSYPHGLPSRRRLGKRNLVLIDAGVKVKGYCSDITRSIPWGRAVKEEVKIIEAVNEAVESAIDSITPGVKASEVDSTARRTLGKYGYSKHFIHGLGHGFGVSVHEPPYITIGSETVIEPGMVFTIEPGVYIPGVIGVRIEEDVLIDNRGARVLTNSLSRTIYP